MLAENGSADESSCVGVGASFAVHLLQADA